MEGQLFDGNWSSSQTRARKPTYLERERAREGGREREESGERGEGGWEDPYEFVTRCFSQVLTKFPRALFNVGIIAVCFALPAQIWK